MNPPITPSPQIKIWVYALWMVGAVLYVTLFWGKAANFYPSPLDQWWAYTRGEMGALWRQSAGGWFTATFVLGMILPAIIMAIRGFGFRDAGFFHLNAVGFRLTMISIIVSIPFGVWLIYADPGDPTYTISKREWWLLLSMIPEHYLICMFFVVVFLPKMSLFASHEPITTGGSGLGGLFRKIGLAQPSGCIGSPRILEWFGLDGRTMLAITSSGFIFFLVHFGKDIAELATSLPGGIAVAYVTLRSRSIWPAIMAHWSLNLVPKAILLIKFWMS